MKQLIIIILLPTLVFAQKKKHNQVPAKHNQVAGIKSNTLQGVGFNKAFSDSTFSMLLPDSGWIEIRKPERVIHMAQIWESPFAQLDTFSNYQITSTRYTVEWDNQILFRAELIKDTMRIEPSLFDSTAVKAKVIIVGGKTFHLKTMPYDDDYPGFIRMRNAMDLEDSRPIYKTPPIK
jgi:hypothetical protein